MEELYHTIIHHVNSNLKSLIPYQVYLGSTTGNNYSYFTNNGYSTMSVSMGFVQVKNESGTWVTVTGENNIKGYTDIMIGYAVGGYGYIGNITVSVS